MLEVSLDINTNKYCFVLSGRINLNPVKIIINQFMAKLTLRKEQKKSKFTLKQHYFLDQFIPQKENHKQEILL